MPVVWDMDRRKYVPGSYNDKGVVVLGSRKHWREILTEGERTFIDAYLRSKTPSDDDVREWERIHAKVLDEGWTGWRLIDGVVHGLSLIPVDSIHEPPVKLGPWHPEKVKKGPMADLLDDFVKEA